MASLAVRRGGRVPGAPQNPAARRSGSVNLAAAAKEEAAGPRDGLHDPSTIAPPLRARHSAPEKWTPACGRCCATPTRAPCHADPGLPSGRPGPRALCQADRASRQADPGLPSGRAGPCARPFGARARPSLPLCWASRPGVRSWPSPRGSRRTSRRVDLVEIPRLPSALDRGCPVRMTCSRSPQMSVGPRSCRWPRLESNT